MDAGRHASGASSPVQEIAEGLYATLSSSVIALSLFFGKAAIAVIGRAEMVRFSSDRCQVQAAVSAGKVQLKWQTGSGH